MELTIIPQDFSVCKVSDYSGVNLEDPWIFTGSTDQEKSLVCPTSRVPENTTSREDGWRAFRIVGVLDFSLVGILGPIADALSEARIGIFAVSTFNTDYVLVKADCYDRAMTVLAGKGYTVVG